MKTILIAISGVISIIGLWVLGYAIPILAVANFLWLLVKDVLLFPWIYLIYMCVAWVISAITAITATIVYIILK